MPANHLIMKTLKSMASLAALSIVAFSLCGCVGISTMKYPEEWAAVAKASSECPDLSGSYRYLGELRDEKGDMGKVRLELLKANGDRAFSSKTMEGMDTVRISGNALQEITVSYFLKEAFLYETTLTYKQDYVCSGGKLTLYKLDIHGKKTEANYYYAASRDGALVSKFYDSSGVLIGFIPLYSFQQRWRRWESVRPLEAAPKP